MAKKCITQVNIPEVDNTQLECDELNLSTCIEVIKICTKIGNLEGENLDKFIERLCFKLGKIDNAIFTLSQRIKVLEEQNIEE